MTDDMKNDTKPKSHTLGLIKKKKKIITLTYSTALEQFRLNINIVRR